MKRFWAILKLRCPKCCQGKVFARWLTMHEACPHCGASFRREPGYFLGAMYFSYALAILAQDPSADDLKKEIDRLKKQMKLLEQQSVEDARTIQRLRAALRSVEENVPVAKGLTARADVEQPIYFWVPSIAPSGMMFYTGDLFPAWKGNLFVGAMVGQALVRLEIKGDRVVSEERLLTERKARVREVRQGPDGAIYLLSGADLLKLTPK